MSFLIVNDYDAGEWQIIHDELPCARHPHRCDACGGEIPAGERYRRVAGKFDGAYRVWREHMAVTS